MIGKGKELKSPRTWEPGTVYSLTAGSVGRMGEKVAKWVALT
jgi:hypothetical protein